MPRTDHIRAFTLLIALAAAATLATVLVGAKPAEAAFPGSNGKIAFASDRTTGTGVDNPTGDYEIFAMNPNGTGLEQLTTNTADDYYPAWSAEGTWIAWTSEQDGNAEIYMRSYPGGGGFFIMRRLTNNPATESWPAFSPDESKIAFRSDRDGNAEIYVMDTVDTSPADGNGDNPINISNNANTDREPAWSPDGNNKIAFTTNRDGNYEIYVMDADPSTDDATNLTKLVNPAQDSEPDWSPDGSEIAFSGDRNNHDIYVMNADGTEQKRLTKKAAGDYEPAWSPDGKKIAFKSTRGGDSEIFVMKAKPESRKKNRPKNLTKNDVVGDFGPDWRPIPQP